MGRSCRGFTLVEMAAVVLVMGLIFGFAIPTIASLRKSHDVKGARDNIIAQVQMARAKAIATGVDQPIHFFTGTYGFDYHIHPAGVGVATMGWKLPQGVSYQWPAGSPMAVTMKKDGKANTSLVIPITNLKGTRDTVSVLASGLVLAQ
ncbi:MAG: prepilin-type N-terminal cleavage/methylation domain-containing protein [Candidatus Eisenbacteria bacterium]